MILAVLEARCGLSLSSAEVYLNIAGGYRLSDPAAATLRSRPRSSAPLPNAPCRQISSRSAKSHCRAEVRPVAHGGLRLKESAKLGFERAWVPPSVKGAKGEGGIALTGFRSLGALVDFMLGRG